MKTLQTLFSVCLMALFACSSAMAADAKPIRIGLLCPLTGQWASEGIDMRRIVTQLADEVNAKGGIDGRPLEIVAEDDAGDPRTAALAAQKLATSNVVAVIGTYGSAITEASQNILDEAELVQIATGSTSVRLSEKNLPFFFRTSPRDDEQGRVAAELIIKKQAKAVAILHDNSSYAKGLASETSDQLKKAGVNVVFYDALTPKERDYNAILTRLKSANPDFIFFTGYFNDAATLLRQKKEMGWNIPMMGGDATNNTDLINIAGIEAAKGFMFISPPVPQDLDTDVTKAFIAAYQKAHNQLPNSVWAVLAGDAFKALESALRAGANDSKTIADYLKTKLKEVHGLTGSFSFDKKGDRKGDLYRLYEVSPEGRFVMAQ